MAGGAALIIDDVSEEVDGEQTTAGNDAAGLYLKEFGDFTIGIGVGACGVTGEFFQPGSGGKGNAHVAALDVGSGGEGRINAGGVIEEDQSRTGAFVSQEVCLDPVFAVV